MHTIFLTAWANNSVKLDQIEEIMVSMKSCMSGMALSPEKESEALKGERRPQIGAKSPRQPSARTEILAPNAKFTNIKVIM